MNPVLRAMSPFAAAYSACKPNYANVGWHPSFGLGGYSAPPQVQSAADPCNFFWVTWSSANIEDYL